MKPSGLLWILSILLFLSAGCGLPVGVFLAGDVIVAISPEEENDLGVSHDFAVDLKQEQRYDTNGLMFYYSYGEDPIASTQLTLNHKPVYFNDSDVVNHDLFTDTSEDFFSFSVTVSEDIQDELYLSYAYINPPPQASGTSQALDVDRNEHDQLFIYARYRVEGFVVGKVQPEVFSSPVIHIATYKIGE